MKDRLILLYELNKIDKELEELDSLRGDIPEQIERLNEEMREHEQEIEELKKEIAEIETKESVLSEEIGSLAQKIDKDDNLLRAGAVKTNQEYNALAKEIGDAYDKIDKNEKIMEEEFKPKKTELTEKLNTLNTEFEDIKTSLKENEEKLKELNKQTEEEELELKRQREELLPKIEPEDLEHYERINKVKYGDAIAIVRKGSCLGCFNSIPPQRVIEIRMADNCEACGGILISEEFLEEGA